MATGAEASSLGFGATGASRAFATACCTTLGVSADCSSGFASGAATAVTGRIGSTTSGADCVGAEIVGAGMVSSVVSGLVAPGFAAARTLSAGTDEADKAVTRKAISIDAVGGRGMKLYAERGLTFHAGPEAVTIECGAGLDLMLRSPILSHFAPKCQPTPVLAAP